MVCKTTLTIAATILATLSTSASAKPGDGNYILESCTSDDPFSTGLCLGYVSGFIGSYSFAQAAGMRRAYCLPEAVTLKQSLDVFVAYLRDNPAKRHANGEIIWLAAMSEAWPCENGPATLSNNGGLLLPAEK